MLKSLQNNFITRMTSDMKKAIKRSLKIILIFITVISGVAILVFAGLNITKYAIYSDYYAIKTNVRKNPGLNEGFVCQGVFAHEDTGRIFVSGYMKDASASRVYITDTDDNYYFVSLSADGAPFIGHAGGIAHCGNTVYIADGGKIFSADINKFLNASNGDTVDIGYGITVNNAADSLFADGEYIYVGEFHDGGKYVTQNVYETPHGTNSAILTQYACDDLSKPYRIYSIPDRIQGVCVTPDGRLVTSSSYGITDSEYCVYDLSAAVDSGHEKDGAPVYYLGERITAVKGPAMAEGLDWYDGGVITVNESASDKYIFGKFFFATKIVSLDI